MNLEPLNVTPQSQYFTRSPPPLYFSCLCCKIKQKQKVFLLTWEKGNHSP